jgi:hypothetical protein
MTSSGVLKLADSIVNIPSLGRSISSHTAITIWHRYHFKSKINVGGAYGLVKQKSSIRNSE